LREAALALRKAENPEEKRQSERHIFDRLMPNEFTANADNVLCYVSAPDELSTELIIGLLLEPTAKKTLAVPRVCADRNHSMDFYVIHDISDLEPGHFGILEPKAHCKPLKTYNNTVCITPGLIFTEDGHRLGYGKGYYDRFFAKRPEILKIGLAFEKNIYQTGFMKTDKYDIPVDIIVTERRIFDVRQRA
jgi:5-formyltetrahydrofolate cyclo-ligase